MRIQIGDVYSYKNPESWTYTPDDRQEKVELINGVAVQDCDYIPAGDTISCSAIFSILDFGTIKTYWINRTRVTVTDESGQSYSNARIIVKSYQHVERFPNFVKAELEFWFT